MATILERLAPIVADKLGVEEERVILEASFEDDLEADSLDLVELIMAFEEEFSTEANRIEIGDERAAQLKTVEAVVQFLKEQNVPDE